MSKPKYKGPLRFPIRFLESDNIIHVFSNPNTPDTRMRYENQSEFHPHACKLKYEETSHILNLQWFLDSTYPVITKRAARRIHKECP